MKRILIYIIFFCLGLTFFTGQADCAQPRLEVKPLYTLSNFSGPVPYDLVRLAVDKDNNEILILNPKDGDIRVFNGTGMEIYRTSPYRDLGAPVDLAVQANGTINLLVMNGNKYSVHFCNYRGEPISEVILKGIPGDLSDMRPSRILCVNDLLYLVDLDSLKVAVFDNEGLYVRGYLIKEILGLEGKEADESSMFGFTVDHKGNFYFTIPVHFSAYRLSTDGEVTKFGGPGSSPGQFSVVSGVAVDDSGNIFLTDRRRSVVMVYGPDLKFVYEFGYRGFGPGNLIVPDDIVLDGKGKVYVAQMRKRGVQVYRMIFKDGSEK